MILFGFNLLLFILSIKAEPLMHSSGDDRSLELAGSDVNRFFANSPKVTVLFLANNLIKTKTIWNDWYENFMSFLTLNKIEQNIWLTGAIYLSQENLKPENISILPKWLQNNYVSNPVSSARFQLMNAMRQLFKYGLDKFSNSDYFILVSDTTIPLKPFNTIWGEIMVDSRSRFDIFCMDHYKGYPKHSQWISLNRKHAEFFVLDHQLWQSQDKLIYGLCPTLTGATDEYFPLRIIMENANIFELKDIQANFIFKEMDNVLRSLEWTTFVDWYVFDTHSAEIAIGKNFNSFSSGHPKIFQSLNSRFLRYAYYKPGLWFMRKLDSDDAIVVNCSEHPLSILGDMLGHSLWSKTKPSQCLNSIPENFGVKGNCKLHEFLRVLMNKGSFYPIVLQEPKSLMLNDVKLYGKIGQHVYSKLKKKKGDELVTAEELLKVSGDQGKFINEILTWNIYRPSLAVSYLNPI